MTEGGRRLRVGILGCAAVARRSTGPALRDDPAVDLRAVASRDADTARATARRLECDAVTGYDRLLDRGDLDAVYVPLPTGLHAPWLRRALDAGLHVLCEKSLTTSYADTRAVLELAARRGLVVMENFMFVHHAQLRVLTDMVAGGALGQLRALSADFAFPPRPADDIRYRPELGGGALLDAGAYCLRAAQHYLGEGLHVSGAVLVEDGRGVDVAGSALLHRDDGVTAQVTFGFEHAYRCSYTLWGSSGRLHLDRAFTTPAGTSLRAELTIDSGVSRLPLPSDNHCAATVARFAAVCRDPGTLRDRDSEHRSALEQARLIEGVGKAATRRRRPAAGPYAAESVPDGRPSSAA